MPQGPLGPPMAPGGASFHPDTLLPTAGEHGFRPVSALAEGDRVLAASGEEIVVALASFLL